MWTLIKKDHFENFINQYQSLAMHYEDIILHENNDHYFLPKLFYKNYPSRFLIKHVDTNWKPKSFDNIEFKGNLWENQKLITDYVMNRINGPEEGGIIKSRPGSGKTVMAINLFAQHKKRTLILVDSTSLVEEPWTRDILRFTNLEAKNIGAIQGDKFYVTDETPIVIGMVQTFVSKVKRQLEEFYIKVRDCGFDLVIPDECHKTTSGQKYATASLLFNTKNIIGLSATPFVQQLHKVLMENSIGPMLSNNNDYDLMPTINFVLYSSGLSKTHAHKISYSKDIIRQKSMFNKIITQSPIYYDVITKLTKELNYNKHKMIIIVHSVNQVTSISSTLTNSNLPNKEFYSKSKELDKANDNIIVATYAYASHGFDFPPLSAIIIGSPYSGRISLIQMIGRILRSYPDKKDPVVYILVEQDFNGMFTKDIPRMEAMLKKEFNCRCNTVQYN